MVTLDAVRAAAMADQPWARLDELVRAEMAAGRRVREVADDFDRLRDDVWNTPGLSEDGSDAFGDTLDGLIGNCGEKWRYTDSPTLPTREEITAFPRWARVAFAARCARRVLPLFRTDLDNFDWSHFDLIQAVEVSEKAAQRSKPDDHARELAIRLEAAADGVRTVDADTGVRESNNASSYAALAVQSAANMASGASELHPTGTDGVIVCQLAELSARPYEIVVDIRRDYDWLNKLASYFHWTDETSVSPDVFGPLWPEGLPAGWPTDPDIPQRSELPLTVAAGENNKPGRRVDEVVNLFNALNRYHIARTGQRLTLEGDIHTRLAALVPAGAA